LAGQKAADRLEFAHARDRLACRPGLEIGERQSHTRSVRPRRPRPAKRLRLSDLRAEYTLVAGRRRSSGSRKREKKSWEANLAEI